MILLTKGENWDGTNFKIGRYKLFRVQKFDYSLSNGFWQSFVTIGSCNHLMRIISTYVDNTKKSEIS